MLNLYLKHQEKRNFCLFFFTNIREICIFRLVKQSNGGFPIVYSTGMEDLLPQEMPDKPTNGFISLVRLLSVPPKHLGYKVHRTSVQTIGGQEVQLGRLLGTGGSSYVFSAVYNEQEVAIKVLSDEARNDFTNELDILKILAGSCPYIPNVNVSVSNQNVLVLTPVGKPLHVILEENTGRLGN